MIYAHYPAPVTLDRRADQRRHAGRAILQQGLERRAAERDDHLGLDTLYLLFQPAVAGEDFALCGRLVQATLATWFPLEMLDGVGHIHAVARHARFLHRLLEQRAGRADKRQARQVFLVARLLAYQHDACLCWANAGHGLRGVLPQCAAAALVQGGGQVAHGLGTFGGYRDHGRAAALAHAGRLARAALAVGGAAQHGGHDGAFRQIFPEARGDMAVQQVGIHACGVENAAVVGQPQGFARVVDIGRAAHQGRSRMQGAAVPQHAGGGRGDHPAGRSHAAREVARHLRQYLVHGFEPGDKAGRARAFRPLAEAHIRMHVVLLAVHGLDHGVQARAIRVGRRDHVVLALLPAPEHLVQKGPAVMHVETGGRLQQLHQLARQAQLGSVRIRCLWRDGKQVAFAGARLPLHVRRRHPERDQLACGRAPLVEALRQPHHRAHAACSSGHRFICCGASAMARRSCSEVVVSRAGK
ncbi:hypothetical protein D3C81_1028480 [compost metagenome]